MSRREEITALQAALAAEHAAIYGYGVVGAQLTRTQRPLADAADAAHRSRRDRLRELILARDAEPVASAPAYRLPYDVRTPKQAAQLGVELEERVAAVWVDAVASVGRQLRPYAGEAVQDAAVRAAVWRGSSTAFPGLRAGEHP